MTTTTNLLADKIGSARALLDAAASPTDDLDAVHALGLAVQTVESATRTAVERARAAGATWEQVGHALAVTKQAAQQRYGRSPA